MFELEAPCIIQPPAAVAAGGWIMTVSANPSALCAPLYGADLRGVWFRCIPMPDAG